MTLAKRGAMTPEQYVRRVRDLLRQQEYAAALDIADRHGSEVEDELTPDQWALLGALLEHAELMQVSKESAPTAPARL